MIYALYYMIDETRGNYNVRSRAIKPCDGIELNKLANYIGGMLDDDQAGEVEAHLSECMSCMDEFVKAAQLLDDKELSVWGPVSQPLPLSQHVDGPFWPN